MIQHFFGHSKTLQLIDLLVESENVGKVGEVPVFVDHVLDLCVDLLKSGSLNSDFGVAFALQVGRQLLVLGQFPVNFHVTVLVARHDHIVGIGLVKVVQSKVGFFQPLDGLAASLQSHFQLSNVLLPLQVLSILLLLLLLLADLI